MSLICQKKKEYCSNLKHFSQYIQLQSLKGKVIHEDVGGSEGIAPPFLILVVDGSELSASHPSHFIPGEITLRTHCIGGWVGSRPGLGAVEERKIFYSCRELNLVSTDVQYVAWSLYRLSYHGSSITVS
jgi:hypothetical protein